MRYEYKVVDAENFWKSNKYKSAGEEMINEYAKHGWRFVHTITSKGNTVGFIFERNH